MPTKGLTPDEEVIVLTNADGQVKASAVVRLYRGDGIRWNYAGEWGVAALVGSQKSHFIRIINLQTRERFFDLEMYYNFSYQTPMELFHTFEGMEQMIGLSFADVSDAKHFAAEVKGNYPLSLKPRADLLSTLKPIQPAAPDSPKRSSPAPASKPKRKGFFGKIFGSGGSHEEEQPQRIQNISGPTDFKHEAHVGWDPENGFEIRNLPESWLRLFSMAGIKESELTDKDTAKFIMDTVVDLTSNLPPPPPPPSAGLPPPPPSGSASIPAAPKAPNAPLPPPVTGGLLAGLQSRAATLKSAEDRKAAGMPDLGVLDSEQEASLANTLAKAMAARRQTLRESDDEDEKLDDDDAAWEAESSWG